MQPSDYPSRLTGLLPTLARLWLVLTWPVLRRRYYRLTVETIEISPGDKVPLLILPQVFNAVLFRGGELLARTIARHPLLSQPGLRVLDMGCGSGVVSVFAARRGATVTAVDINPAAVRCTQINAMLNKVEDRVETRQGDLFAPVSGRQFDLVVFNPPFFRGKPKHMLDAAWRSEDVFERFADGLAQHLPASGRAWLLLSTEGAGNELLSLLQQRGYAVAVVAEKRWVSEIMTVYGVSICTSSPAHLSFEHVD